MAEDKETKAPAEAEQGEKKEFKEITVKMGKGLVGEPFQGKDTVAASNLGSFTISTSSVPAGATITKIVVTSTKSTGSTGTIRVYVGKEVGSDLWIDNALWSSTVTFNDFAGLSADGTYYFQFESTRYTSSGIAAATLKNVTVKVYYN